MEISLDTTKKTQGIIKISLNRSDFQPGVDQKIKEYSKTANIKGFRPGKVPQGMIRKMYGTSLIVEEINKLVSEKLNTYLRESDTQFLGEPIPVELSESPAWETQEDFLFEYEVGFAEPFDLKVDKKFKIEKHSIKIDDGVIDETIENLQRQFGEEVDPDLVKEVEEHDTIYGNLTANKGEINQEVSFDLRDAEKSGLKKLVGLKLDEEAELDPKKSFKHDHVLKSQLRLSDEELKQLKGKVHFTLKAITRNKPAEINQAFFDKTFGEGTIADEEAFRARVKEVVSQNYAQEEKNFFESKLKEKFVDSVKINLPDEFLKKWLVKSNEQLTEEMIEKDYDFYAKDVKWSLISNKLVEEKELKAEHEEVVEAAKDLIKKQLAGSGIGNQMDDQMDAFANNYLQGEEGQNYMKMHNQVQSEKVLNHIKDEITIKEKEVSLDDFRKL